MTCSYIVVEQKDGIGRITLNRPDILNPLCTDMLAQCREALAGLRENGAAVIVLTGAGRAFCAGADLKFLERMLQESEAGEDRRYEEMNGTLLEGHALIRDLRAFPGPVVSLVNGPAVGGGVGLALAADIVLAAKSAYFSLPFVPKLGLVPDLGGFAFIQNRIGVARAMGCALLGDPLDAETAADWGLIWRCVKDRHLEEAAAELAGRLSSLPKSAVVALKQMSAQALTDSLPAFLDCERMLQASLFAGSDAAEGLRAVIEKRRPDFRPA